MSDDDERALSKIREGFTAPELSAAESAAFDARLDERIGQRANRWAIPAGLAVAATSVAMVLLWPAQQPAPTLPPTAARVVDAGVTVAEQTIDDALTDEPDYWAWDVDDDPGEDGVTNALPDDYLALAEVLTPLDEDDPLEVFR